MGLSRGQRERCARSLQRPLTFAHEGGDTVVHDVGGHHGVVGGGVVPHGLKAGVLGDGIQCCLRQLPPQKLGHLGNLLAEVLWDMGRCSPLLPPRPDLTPPSTLVPYLLQVLIKEVEDGVVLPPLPVVPDMVVPRAICHCEKRVARAYSGGMEEGYGFEPPEGCPVPPLPAMNSSRYWAHVPGCGCNLFIRSKW